MKNTFEEGRARMSAEERERLWSRIAERTVDAGSSARTGAGSSRWMRRSSPLWRIWTPMAVGAAASVVMVMTMWDKAPSDEELRRAGGLKPTSTEAQLAAEPARTDAAVVEAADVTDATDAAADVEGVEGMAAVDAVSETPAPEPAPATAPDTVPSAKIGTSESGDHAVGGGGNKANSPARTAVAADELESEGTEPPQPAVQAPTASSPGPSPEKGEGKSTTRASLRESVEAAPAATDTTQVLLRELNAQPNEIVGRVVDQNGKPVPYASVVVTGTQWGAMSQDDGSFRISGLPDGTYSVRSLIIGYTQDEHPDVKVGEEPAAVMFQVEETTLGSIGEVDIARQKERVDVKPTETSHEITSSSRGAGQGVRGEPKVRMYDKSDRTGRPSGTDGMSIGPSTSSPPAGQAVPSGGRSSQSAGAADEASSTEGESLLSPPTLYGFQFSVQPEPEQNDELRRVSPKAAPYDAVTYRDYGANPLVWTDRDPLSTFAVDVDNGSYTIARRYLGDGYLPDPASVRVEEFVNYFGPGYPEFDDTDFRIYADGSPSPYRDGFELVRIGLQARTVDESERPSARLTFVVDVSGSMERENRLGLVRQSLHMLVDRLRDDDEVALVAYGSTAEVVLRPTSARNADEIDWAIERLVPNGSTNAEDGLRLGYEMAGRMYEKGAINRILLCSDGVANVGRTGPEAILRTVRTESDRGIYLTTIGFGMGNYNDVLMEQLADQGDGAYYYVDQYDEAERVLVRELTGTLLTVARDAKVQVEFDRETVEAYRLIGFENRDVADRDFRNDSVDAGEIGSGHSVVALYEVKLRGDRGREIGDGRERRLDFGRNRYDLATVRLRYALPDREGRHGEPVVREISRGVSTADLSESFGRAPLRFRLAAVVGQYAEVLRNSYWAQDVPLADLVRDARDLAFYLKGDDEAAEFARLVERAADIQERMSIAERERWWPRMEARAPDYPPRRDWRR
ncbi:MAG: von Willebrand factor type A domain-containing protein [Candidatus Eisenbacteria bacterium]